MQCDLHIHSNHSDGTCTIEQILQDARQLGLTVALTDHNTISGVPAFLQRAQQLGVTAVAGTELSAVYEGRDLHLLGLFIPEEAFAQVEALTRGFLTRKEESNIALVKRLNAAGYHLDYANIKARNITGNVNRALIAAALVEQGYVASVKDAFKQLLSESKGYYVPPERLDLFDGIAFLRRIKAVPVLAHPLLDLDEAQLRRLLPQAIHAGLMGMEVQHSSYDNEKIALATAIAAEYRLLPSGGSDFHGQNKPDVKLGIGKGNLDIPLSYYQQLLQCSNALK